MATTWPSSPSNGDKFTQGNGTVYIYNSATKSWKALISAGGGGQTYSAGLAIDLSGDTNEIINVDPDEASYFEPLNVNTASIITNSVTEGIQGGTGTVVSSGNFLMFTDQSTNNANEADNGTPIVDASEWKDVRQIRYNNINSGVGLLGVNGHIVVYAGTTSYAVYRTTHRIFNATGFSIHNVKLIYAIGAAPNRGSSARLWFETSFDDLTGITSVFRFPRSEIIAIRGPVYGEAAYDDGQANINDITPGSVSDIADYQENGGDYTFWTASADITLALETDGIRNNGSVNAVTLKNNGSVNAAANIRYIYLQHPGEESNDDKLLDAYNTLEAGSTISFGDASGTRGYTNFIVDSVDTFTYGATQIAYLIKVIISDQQDAVYLDADNSDVVFYLNAQETTPVAGSGINIIPGDEGANTVSVVIDDVESIQDQIERIGYQIDYVYDTDSSSSTFGSLLNKTYTATNQQSYHQTYEYFTSGTFKDELFRVRWYTSNTNDITELYSNTIYTYDSTTLDLSRKTTTLV